MTAARDPQPALVERILAQPIEGCACGRRHVAGLKRLRIGPGVLDEVGEFVPAESRARGALLLVADPDTYDAAGATVAGRLRAEGFTVREVVTGLAPHADDVTLDALRPALAPLPAAVVAVGSGTIGDLGKALAFEAGVELYTVGTAASMNGYASPIVALTVRGLKVTRPSRPPVGVLLDTHVLAAAPPRLSRAGFGDLISKPVSGADWVLGQILFGDAVCPTALGLADDAVSRARARAAGIGAQDPASLAILAEALVLSGISMDFAGASSPASGGEHLLSHYLDISEAGWSRTPRLHGEQVAVGTLVSLALYRRLRAAGPPAAAAGEPLNGAFDEPALRDMHAHLPPSALDELVGEARKKYARVPGPAARRQALRDGWDGAWLRLDAQLAFGERLVHDLSAAGAPHSFGAIGVPRDMAQRLIVRARHMRDRFTVLDLAADCGALEGWAGEIAEELAG